MICEYKMKFEGQFLQRTLEENSNISIGASSQENFSSEDLGKKTKSYLQFIVLSVGHEDRELQRHDQWFQQTSSHP